MGGDELPHYAGWQTEGQRGEALGQHVVKQKARGTNCRGPFRTCFPSSHTQVNIFYVQVLCCTGVAETDQTLALIP